LFKVNRGQGYNPSTGVFTAPRKGLYHIACLILGNNGHAVSYQLNKNDAVYTKGFSTKGEQCLLRYRDSLPKRQRRLVVDDHLKPIKHTIYVSLPLISKLPWIGFSTKGEHTSSTISSLVEMTKGDRVFIKHRASGSEQIYGDHHSTFSGYFLQE
jgi:hypothetical protein